MPMISGHRFESGVTARTVVVGTVPIFIEWGRVMRNQSYFVLDYCTAVVQPYSMSMLYVFGFTHAGESSSSLKVNCKSCLHFTQRLELLNQNYISQKLPDGISTLNMK